MATVLSSSSILFGQENSYNSKCVQMSTQHKICLGFNRENYNDPEEEKDQKLVWFKQHKRAGVDVSLWMSVKTHLTTWKVYKNARPNLFKVSIKLSINNVALLKMTTFNSATETKSNPDIVYMYKTMLYLFAEFKYVVFLPSHLHIISYSTKNMTLKTRMRLYIRTKMVISIIESVTLYKLTHSEFHCTLWLQS